MERQDDKADEAGGRAGGRPLGPVGDEQWDLVPVIQELITSTWTVPILRQLANGLSRPEHVRQAVNAEARKSAARHGEKPKQLSRSVFFRTVKKMRDEDHLIESDSTAEFPLKANYWMTELGSRVLDAVLDAVARLAAAPAAPASRWLPALFPEPRPVPGVNSRVPSMARVWNVTHGGGDNFAVDREAAAAVLAKQPALSATARWSRAFLVDAVDYLVRKEGVRQFIDIGTGLPSSGAPHEVAQQHAPESRVVYADIDDQVVMYARALLRSDPAGACDYVLGDVRDPDQIIDCARRTLDLGQPVAIILVMVLHFVADAEDPWGIVRRLMEGIRGPAFLVIGHAAADHDAVASAAAAREYNRHVPTQVTLRDQDAVKRFYTEAGCEMLGPGLVSFPGWFPGRAAEIPPGVNGHVGIGRRGPR